MELKPTPWVFIIRRSPRPIKQIDKGENSCYTIIVKKLSNVAKAQKMSYNRHRSAYCIMIAVYSREGYR